MNFPKTYKTRDNTVAVIEHEQAGYYIGFIQLGKAKIATAWNNELNSAEKPEWDLMEAEREQEIY